MDLTQAGAHLTPVVTTVVTDNGKGPVGEGQERGVATAPPPGRTEGEGEEGTALCRGRGGMGGVDEGWEERGGEGIVMVGRVMVGEEGGGENLRSEKYKFFFLL